ncbi:MAG: RDD family protein [Dongiaceae bacterium]
MTERKLPAIVLGGMDAKGDGSIHDPLLHPGLYSGVALRRMFAFFLDIFLMGVVLTVAMMAAATLWVISFTLISIPVVLGALVFVVLYDVFTIGGPSSATPGMRVFGLKVINWSGGRPDNLQALLMSALFWTIHWLTGWLAAVVVFLNPRWRCAHDFLAGTVVIRADVPLGR